MTAPHTQKSCTSPYPGLRPFEAHEAHIFFGRDDQTDALLGRLNKSHFLAVVGPSGCGKSSLVRAGMIASLNSGFLAEAGTRWRVAEMRPGEEPLERMAKALLSPNALGREEGEDASDLAFAQATLRRGRRGLVELLEERPLPEGTNLLLLVDQFEEIFRFRSEVDPDEADAFVGLLLEAVKQPDKPVQEQSLVVARRGVIPEATKPRETPVYVVFTMRSDFLGDCALFGGLPEAMNDNQFLTPRLERDERAKAIVEPAGVFGGEIEPGLVNRLLNDVGSDPDRLPILQHTLMRMWAKAAERAAESGDGETPAPVYVMREDYEAVGEMNALSQHADEVYYGLKDDRQRRIAEVMFRRLTERGAGKRDTRRPARLGDVAAAAGAAPEEVAAVADEFRKSDRSFVTPPEEISLDKKTKLDIGHESLIWQWGLLSEWVKAEAESAETYQRIKQSALLWKRGDTELWGGVDINKADEWKEKEPKPTPEWASRYGSDEEYALAMEFLDKSKENWAKEKQQRIDAQAARVRLEERTRNMRKLIWLAGALALLALMAMGMTAVAYTQRMRVLEDADIIREQARRLADEIRAAEDARVMAQRQKDEAVLAKEAAEEAGEVAEARRKEAEAATGEAQRLRDKAVRLEKQAEAEAAEAKRQKERAEKVVETVSRLLDLSKQDEQPNGEPPAQIEVALVSVSRKVSVEELRRVARALQIQVERDFGPVWSIKNATINVYESLDDIPDDSWPFVVSDSISASRYQQTDLYPDSTNEAAGGKHVDARGHPYALIPYNGEHWTFTASRVLLGMLANPYGRRTVSAASPIPEDGGRVVNFLVEPCDPLGSAGYGYDIDGVLVSDFYTPRYFDKGKEDGVSYSFKGNIREPRQVLEGGSLLLQDLTTRAWSPWSPRL